MSDIRPNVRTTDRDHVDVETEERVFLGSSYTSWEVAIYPVRSGAFETGPLAYTTMLENRDEDFEAVERRDVVEALSMT